MKPCKKFINRVILNEKTTFSEMRRREASANKLLMILARNNKLRVCLPKLVSSLNCVSYVQKLCK